jgi:uncharacterized protein
MKTLILSIIKIYKKTLSPIFVQIFGHACRFTPTCSDYLSEAIEKKGLIRGVYMGIKRILKCTPLSKPGYDPVV